MYNFQLFILYSYRSSKRKTQKVDGNRLQYWIRYRNSHCIGYSLFVTRMETHSISDIFAGFASVNTFMVCTQLCNVLKSFVVKNNLVVFRKRILL